MNIPVKGSGESGWAHLDRTGVCNPRSAVEDPAAGPEPAGRRSEDGVGLHRARDSDRRSPNPPASIFARPPICVKMIAQHPEPVCEASCKEEREGCEVCEVMDCAFHCALLHNMIEVTQATCQEIEQVCRKNLIDSFPLPVMPMSPAPGSF